jgi:hypothetical protein
VHHRFVGNVAVGEYGFIGLQVPALRGKVGFLEDRDAVRIQRSGQGRRVAAPGDARNLRRRKGHDIVCLVLPEHDIEVMEVTSRGAHDDDALSLPARRHGLPPSGISHYSFAPQLALIWLMGLQGRPPGHNLWRYGTGTGGSA